jgi:translation elongation factor EF-1alpha
MILSSITNPVNPITEFLAQIQTVDIEYPLMNGQMVTLHSFSLKVPVKIIKLKSKFTKKGEKKNPK